MFSENYTNINFPLCVNVLKVYTCIFKRVKQWQPTSMYGSLDHKNSHLTHSQGKMSSTFKAPSLKVIVNAIFNTPKNHWTNITVSF